MELTRQQWNEYDFVSLREYLVAQTDENFRVFNEKILNTDKQTLGIRIPQIRKMAKEIIKGNANSFLSGYQPQYHEEKLLMCIVITDAKLEYPVFLNAFDSFLDIIDNWAQCDILCSGLKKAIKKRRQEFFDHLQSYLKSQNPWIIRVGIVAMLSEYIQEEFISEVFCRVDAVDNPFYYVKMANAWLVSVAMVKLPEKTKAYMLESQLDKWTFNKAIQKCRESFRVAKEDKAWLLTLKK